MLCLAGLVAGSALAGVAPGGTMPEALKGLNPASSMCKREDVLAGAAAPSPAAVTRRDAVCALSPAQLDSMRSDPRAALIDVRNSPLPLPEGIATMVMPLSAVRTKAFLRDKTVVLLGNGRMERELYEACGALLEQGFARVRVLQGGVPNWPAAGRAGDTLSWSLTAAELWAESQSDANLVLLSTRRAGLRKQLPGAVDLPALTPDAARAAVKQWRRERKAAHLSAVVLAAMPEDEDEAVQRLRDALHPVPVLVYTENDSTYLRQLVQQQTVWAAQARGPRKPACGL
ncbi:rhodanese-like domain-containing protein [Rhizobacter sp. LjRoot28]|uniref:rhodanese-like domain-containing protein n=1 Tax=Rhizobacter sp. LjRoot28 TaxID=3342309 RepID=UPI003F504A3A